MKSESIQTKEKSPLFYDYVSNYEKVRDFFHWDYRKDLQDCIEKRGEAYQNRKALADVLMRQNRKWGASRSSLKNIEKFSDAKTMAVVTGQQAGILGGPLYTVYKILHAIKLAEQLHEKHGDFQFIPVFWMEVGDSDYKEINHLYLLNIQSELQRLELPEDPDDGRSIYLRSIPDEMADVFSKLEDLFPSNEFRDQLLADVKSIYSPGKSFANAFGEWIHYLFKDTGVVVIDPADSQLSEISRPLIKKTIKAHREIREIFSKATRKVEQAGYTPQVNLLNQQTLLFYRMDNDDRARIDGEKAQFTVRDGETEKSWSTDALLEEIERSPQKFTPNVILRPILQDWLLPTVCYIGGPGEISYDAQLNDLYTFFKIVPPHNYLFIHYLLFDLIPLFH